ncbi:flagellar basal body P-ring formation chaperone FlgA [Sulfitobacter sp. S190]|uniref:flagellar basal body P-ring formation chaperone FlgA n=1 Tax=Sulfitobacter sp. S190 TaxID=2867022 RepID=UPI0021A40DBB|nr:flagellar basal body P-ring formation chaperone FlgA [Sulfitobacter sp. S190]UWR22369.1 flagellar basal body P-ring formation protein FlgA [Sulfitobacter sp. S190]
MKNLFASLAWLACTIPALADTVVPSRTIRPNTLITEMDVKFAKGDLPNGFSRLSDVIGQEARVALYPGRPIYLDDIGPPALVDRNQLVLLRFTGQGLVISAEGRALERGAAGDMIRAMNLTSRATLFGQVQPDGSLIVRR